MSRQVVAKQKLQTARLNCGFVLLVGIALVLSASPSFAHAFDAGKSEYEDFISGNQAVLADLPVLFGLIAAGLFAGIWKSDGWPFLWPFYIIGLIAGAVLGFSGIVPPTIPTYTIVIIIGLLGAAEPRFELSLMRGIYVFIGIVLTNAVLSGHTVSEIPVFAYVGIALALNTGVAVSAGLVSVSLQSLSYSWVIIAWRAAMSWLVAITVMALALTLNATT